jgi:hypothetical protein
LKWGDEEIRGGLPAGSVIESNRLIKKTLNKSETFSMTFTDCELVNMIVDYKNHFIQNLKIGYTNTGNTDLSKAIDGDKMENGVYTAYETSLNNPMPDGIQQNVWWIQMHDGRMIEPDYFNMKYSVGASNPEATGNLEIYVIDEGDNSIKLLTEENVLNQYKFMHLPVKRKIKTLIIAVNHSFILPGDSMNLSIQDMNFEK